MTDSTQLAWKIRRHAVEMVHHAHASHIGGILSSADIVAVLYSDILRYDPDDPTWKDRDRFVLSKGHCGVAVYAALAECGFFPIEKLMTYGDDGTDLSCHVSHNCVPGVEISTGSLGHGACVALGMAINAKRKSLPYRTYALVGDGECNEGTIWEMAMLAAQEKLDNFTVIVDANGMQAMGRCADIIDTSPLSARWKAFGWHAVCTDGHDHDALRKAFYENTDGRPKAIIASTIKGKGVSFMENELLWHYRDPQGPLYDQAVRELEEHRP